MRGDDVASDHHLLITIMSLCLKIFTKDYGTRTKYNIELLRKKDTQSIAQVSLSNRFQLLQEPIEDNETVIETRWEYSKIWHETCEKVLGKKKTNHRTWISANNFHKLEKRKRERNLC